MGVVSSRDIAAPQISRSHSELSAQVPGVTLSITSCSGSNIGDDTDDRLGIMWILYIVGVILGCTPLILCAPICCCLSASCWFCRGSWSRLAGDFGKRKTADPEQATRTNE